MTPSEPPRQTPQGPDDTKYRKHLTSALKSVRGESGILEIQCLSVTMTVRWEKCSPGRHVLHFCLHAPPAFTSHWLIHYLQHQRSSPFRAQAGPGPSLSSVWHCSRTNSGPWWPASWRSGWRHGLVAASAPHRQLASAEAKTQRTKGQRSAVCGNNECLSKSVCQQRRWSLTDQTCKKKQTFTKYFILRGFFLKTSTICRL